jgi:hypothetical protein
MGFWNIRQYILMDRPSVSGKHGFSNIALKIEAVCSSET